MTLWVLYVLIAAAWLTYPFFGATWVAAQNSMTDPPGKSGFSSLPELIIYPPIFCGVAFVSVIGLDFLKSSAVSKASNVAADLSSWTVLAIGGFVQWALALPLIVGNMLGSYVGSHLAIRRGDRFIRMVFLSVVLALVARIGWGLLG